MKSESRPVAGAHLRRGWCPTATVPMASADGLLLRVRPPGGRIDAPGLRRLAAICRLHANGAVVLTRRGKLELRGITDADATGAALMESGLVSTGEIDLPDRIVSPATDLDPQAADDATARLPALDRALAGRGYGDDLAAKFALVLDGGGRAHVGGVNGDVRFDALAGRNGIYRVALGGTAETAVPLGRCAAEDIPAVAVALLDRFRRLCEGREAELWRVRHVLAERGVGPFNEAASAWLLRDDRLAVDRPVVPIVGHAPDAWYGAAFAFGRLDADTLLRIADAAERYGDGDLRILPTRAVLLSRAGVDAAGDLRAAGAIDTPADPRLRAEACVGRGGCDRGTTATLEDARTFVASAPTLLGAGNGAVLHVSGCAKGCAHSGPAAVTLTGRDGRYDLSIADAAGSVPLWRGLDVPAAASRLAVLERVFLEYRDGDERPLAALARLDPDWLWNRVEEEMAGG